MKSSLAMRAVLVVIILALSAVEFCRAATSDVCVVGGGVAGVAAALQAGRAGARTVLVEQAAMVGGNMTSGGVNWPGLFHAWGRQVIDGCGWELVTNCVTLAGGTLPDFAHDPGREHWRHQVRINAPLWVVLAEEALTKAGVEIRYHAHIMERGWKTAVETGRPLSPTFSATGSLSVSFRGSHNQRASSTKNLEDPNVSKVG